MTGATGKSWLRKRIEHFFTKTTNQSSHSELYKQWKTLAARNSPPYPPLLDIVVNKIQSRTVRFVKNHQTVENRQKAEFLEQFDPAIEEETWEIINENTGTKTPEKDKEQDNEGESDAMEQLEKYCNDTKQDPPQYIINTEKDKSGTPWYIATVTHQKDQKIFGVGHSESEEESKILAAIDAVFTLNDYVETEHGPDDNAQGKETSNSTNSDQTNGNPGAMSQSSSSTTSTSNENPGEMSQFSSSTTGTSNEKSGQTATEITMEKVKTGALEVMQSTIENMMKNHFDELLKDALNRMKTTFETLLTPLAEEAVKKTIDSTIEIKVNSKISNTIAIPKSVLWLSI